VVRAPSTPNKFDGQYLNLKTPIEYVGPSPL